MNLRSDQNKLIDWLNTLIVMAQWDKTLPLYFARLFERPDRYQTALQLIREAAPESWLETPTDPINKEEWRRLYRVTSGAESLRKLFAGDGDPFYGARAEEISVLADVSDLTTDSQTLFYSRNGTFQLVLEAVRQSSELNTAELITEGLNKFYTLFDTNETVAEELYKLACSYDWYPVLASLYDVRDYTTDESLTAKQSLDQWNRNLTTELRSIILKPTKLYRVPKKLIKLAWERPDLFARARNFVAVGTSPFELRQQVANIAYAMFAEEAKDGIAEIESDLEVLAIVARHFISVRKFAKLDGLVYAWPRIASLAMANYANLEYVEDFFIARKPRPLDEELDLRDAGELYELCANNGGLIRFLKLRPYFKEIDEDELRRYRPLAPVTISDPSQPPSPTPQADIPVTVAPPQIINRPRVCELRIIGSLNWPENYASQEVEYEVVLVSGDSEAKGKTTFSITDLLERTFSTIGATSEESVQAILRGLFSGANADQILVRGGSQILHTIISQSGLDDALAKVFQGDGPLRLMIRSELEQLQFLPWEWLPRPGYSELLLSNPQYSIVRSRPSLPVLPVVPLASPVRIMGLFPNSPVGRRDISENSIKSLEALESEGARYLGLVRDQANFIRVNNELVGFVPHVVHYEGEVGFLAADGQMVTFVFSFPTTSIERVDLTRFAHLLAQFKVQLLVVGRNESSRVFNNPLAAGAYRMLRQAIPAMLAPIRVVDDSTATSFLTEFYHAFLTGSTLERALYTARRKVASRGGDWTSFALFANPTVLDTFQTLPPLA